MHTFKTRVYYEDTDAQGVVYYANYLRFFERARTEALRGAGYGQMKLMKEGLIFVVRNVEMKLLKPARLDDELSITTSLVKLGKVSFDFNQDIYNKEVEVYFLDLIRKQINFIIYIFSPIKFVDKGDHRQKFF